MHWMDRLVNSFFSFRPARNWRCRFPEHNGSHYQDEIAVDGATAEWLLHGKLIARLLKLEGGWLLELRDAGYPTVTTVSRLNSILWRLCELYPDSPKMVFRLKYTQLVGGYPDHMFLMVDGRAYNLNLLPEKTVRILVDGRAVPLLPTRAEYLYFMQHPRLEWLRRLYRGAKEALGEAWRRLGEVEGFLSGVDGFEEERARCRELRERLEAAEKALGELEWRCRLSTLGVAAGADLGALRRKLGRLRAELREVDDAAARLQAAVRLLS